MSEEAEDDLHADDESRELDEQIAGYLRLGLPAATLVCAAVGGVLQGAAAVVIVLAAGALVAVIAIFWASIRTLVGETALSGADAYALGAPRAEEEQKRAVLRALKDLEFERSVGKISEEDYQELVAKYRAEGKRLMRMLDEEAQPRRHKVEALVLDRLAREGLLEAAEREQNAAPEPAPKRDKAKAKANKPAPAKDIEKTKPAEQAKPAADDDARPVSMGETPKPPAQPVCAACGTRNDADAVFCKKCGARQIAEEPPGRDDEDEDERDEDEAEEKA